MREPAAVEPAAPQYLRRFRFEPRPAPTATGRMRAGVVLAINRCMDRNTVRNALLAQHERIREDLARCRELSKHFLAGEEVAAELDLALARLRADFDEHNRSETGMLLPLLLHASQGRSTRGTLLAERMLEEHAAEHTAFWQRIDAPRHEVAAHLDELGDEIEAHMAAEERTFLSPLLLRADATEHPVSGSKP